MSAHLPRYAIDSAQAFLRQHRDACDHAIGQLGYGVAARDRSKACDSLPALDGVGMARRIIENAEAVHEWADPVLRCPEHAYWDYRCAAPGCAERATEKVRSYDGLVCPTCGKDWGG